MTAEDWMRENPPVTRKQAANEILMHGLEFSDFVGEYGDHAEYNAADVLTWLGY